MNIFLFPYGKEMQIPGADDFPKAEGRTRGKSIYAHGARAEKPFHRGTVNALHLHVQRRESQIHNAMQAHTRQKLSVLLPYFEKNRAFPSMFS